MSKQYKCGHKQNSSVYEELSIIEKVDYVKWKYSKDNKFLVRCFFCWRKKGVIDEM